MTSEQRSPTAERAGLWRDDDPTNAELGSDARSVQRACAAARYEGARREVEPLLRGIDADRVSHVEVVDAHHPLGGLEDTEAERSRHVELDRPLCEPGIERHPAAEVVARAEQAEHEVSVGRRRQLTAAPVAGGTRVGSSARRTNHQTAVGRHSGDRAAASADRRDVEHRHVDVVADEATLCHLKRSALVDHCDVGARAADVEGDQLILVDRPYERHRTLNSGGRAGQQRVDRSAAVQHRPEGHQTSIRLHQEELVECKPAPPSASARFRTYSTSNGSRLALGEDRRDPRPFPDPGEDIG